LGIAQGDSIVIHDRDNANQKTPAGGMPAGVFSWFRQSVMFCEIRGYNRENFPKETFVSKLPRLMRILGWIVFTVMWIPFCLMFLFMPGEGDNPFKELISPFTISFASMFVLMFIAMGLLFGSPAVSWLLGQVAKSRGERTTARIMNIRPTGMRVNNYYDGIQFDLELYYMGETIQTSTEKLVPRFGAPDYQNGMTVNVMYDPFTKSVSMID
jgi:hypothetical protein